MKTLFYILLLGTIILLLILILIIISGIKSIKRTKEKAKANKCPYYIEKED